MSITVEAVYENGVLKPSQPLPLKEREKVQVTIQTALDHVRRTAGLIPCSDHELIEHVAMDPDLEYPSQEEP